MSDTGTTTAATTTTTVPAWFDGFDAEAKGYIQNRGLDKMKPEEAILKTIQSHREAERHLGVPANELLRLPKDASDAEGWRAFNERIGVPADEKGYDFSGVKFADGTDIDPEFASEMGKVLREARVPKDRAADVLKKIVELGDKGEAGEKASLDAKLAQERETLRINWGANVERNMVVADNAAAKMGVTKEQMTAMRDHLGAAKVAEVFFKMGTLMGEDKFVSGTGVNGTNLAMSKEMAVDRLATLQNDSGWITKLSSGDATTMQEFDNLTRIVAQR